MRNCASGIALAVLALALSSRAEAGLQPVLQRGYDANVDGANLAEATLNTANVAPSTFGLVFTLPVDDDIYAQPLYAPGVAISGQGTHNVVYVSTMSDSLYAFDADSGVQLWSINLASSVGATPVPVAKFVFSGNTNIVSNLGILSTPVIDPSTNILYLVACTLENNTMVYRLHAVNITNGTEPYPNVVISGSYNGVTFDAPHQTQRVSLALSGNQVVFAFAAMEEEGSDVGGYAGWVMAYNKTTLAQSGIFATVSTGTLGGGVWQSGRPPVVDSSGYVYVFVGNGYVAGYDGVHDFSESALKLDPANNLNLLDWFTPSNWSALDSIDADLSSSGPMLIPNTSLITGGGKASVLYVLNAAPGKLGKESTGDSGAVQELTITAHEIRGGPVYWQRSSANGGPLLYDWGDGDLLKAYPFNGTTFATTPSAQGGSSLVYPGAFLALSANGDTPGSGVLWATVAASGDVFSDPADPGILYAFDANDVSTELWNSTMNSARDNFGNFAKFVPPLVANGRVYVATFSKQVAVYGLLGTGGGGGGGGSSVSLAAVADVDGIASNGTAPVNGGWDDTGDAYSANLLGSSITYGGSTFTFGTEGANDAVSSTTIPLPAGNYTTLNLLGGAAHGAQTNQSFVVTYTDGTTTTITQSLSDWWGPPQNFAGESQVSKMAYLVTPTGATQNTTVYLYGYSLAINSAKTVKSLTLPANRNVIILAVDVTGSGGGTPVAATPTFSLAPGSYAGAQSVTLSDTTPGAVIYYTTNSTAPTLSSAQFIPGTPIAVSTTETIEAMAVASGYTNSAVASGSYVIGSGGGGSSVSLAAVADVDGIASNGTAPVNGGWDDTGDAYSANLLGSSITYGGSTFTFGTEGANDAVSSTTIPLPAGNYTTLNLLGGAAHGAQTNQSFVVTYTDGTTTTITQSLSDWWGPPQNFAGESQVSKMAYLVTPTGATQNTTVYLYGYSLAINSAKTVKSLTLPANRNVIILAVDVTGSGGGTPVAATPTFSPAPGSYAGAQSVTLSDTTPGAVIYYTTNSTAPTLSSAQFIPGTPIAVSTTETIEAMAVASGYTNSAVASGSYVIGSSGGGSSSVSLAAVADVDGIASNGTAPVNGGWDDSGDAYSANLLGSSITYGGSTFTFGTEGANDAVSSTTIPLPAGNYTTLNLLGGAAHGAQTNQSFVVTYTDGTTTTITQSLSDWWGPPQNFAGESQVSKMAYLVTPTGATQNEVVYLYGYSLAINSAKTVKSLTLPANRNVIILAVDVTGSGGGGSSSVNLAAVADVDGIASNGTAPIDGGWDNTGDAYSANLLGSSITYGGSTFTFGTEGANDAVSSTTIPLPAGNYTTLNLLGGAAHGAQTNQSFVVTYTDGTTTTITQSLSDWWGPPQNFAGESQVSKMAYLVTPTGATQNEVVYLYGYSLAINSAKTVKSLTLPANRNVIILALDEVP